MCPDRNIISGFEIGLCTGLENAIASLIKQRLEILDEKIEKQEGAAKQERGIVFKLFMIIL